MDHLSSCYFCGTALDEPLQEYAVVPPALRDADDDVTTATLCSTCQRKLERVLDTVLAAAGGHSPGESELTDTASGDDADDGTSGSGPQDVLVDPDDAIDSPDEDDITAADVTAMAGDVDTDEATEVEGDDEEREPLAEGGESDDADEKAAADAASTAGDVDADVPDDGDEDGDTDEAGVDETPGDEGGADDAPEEETEPLADSGTGAAASDASPADSSGSEDETETHEADDTDERAAETDDSPESAATGDEGDATPGARTSISALEYNKVMRLLQNREFPVDRAEIETVAANAYDLSRQECAAVIDLAVDRGLITESDGQLARPE